MREPENAQGPDSREHRNHREDQDDREDQDHPGQDPRQEQRLQEEQGLQQEQGDHEEHDYRGEALVLAEEREIAVDVVLRGYFEPIDGRFHWYGRLRPNDEITDMAASRKVPVVLRTPVGEAVGSLSEPDPWGRYRVLGIGRPPFPVDASLEEMASSSAGSVSTG